MDTPPEDALQLGERYEGLRLRSLEAARSERRARRQAAFRARYVEGPVLWLPVDEFGYGFDPADVAILDGVGQVYTEAEVRGGWGRLAVTGGVLLERGERGITGVRVPAPPDPSGRPVLGEGWTLDLSEGWEIVPGERRNDWVVRAEGS